MNEVGQKDLNLTNSVVCFHADDSKYDEKKIH